MKFRSLLQKKTVNKRQILIFQEFKVRGCLCISTPLISPGGWINNPKPTSAIKFIFDDGDLWGAWCRFGF